MKSTIRFTLLATLLAFPLLGCASSGDPQRQAAVNTIKGVQAYSTAAEDAKAQVGETLSAMEALPGSGTNLADAYDTYVDQLDAMEQAMNQLREQRGEMRTRFARYQENWYGDTLTLESENLQQAAQRRLQEVRRDFEAVEPSYQEVTRTGNTFLGKLSEVRRYLANDLTAPALDALAPSLEQSRQTAADFRTALDRLVVKLTTLRESLQPETSANVSGPGQNE